MRSIYNFSAGPAVLPEPVLQEAADEMLDYKGSGMSVMEISHRSSLFQSIIDETEQKLCTLMNIPDDYVVLFLQGGTSLQFSMIPMNFMRNRKADYILTGYWAKKAYEEAKRYGLINIAASSEGIIFHISRIAVIWKMIRTRIMYICVKIIQSMEPNFIAARTVTERHL